MTRKILFASAAVVGLLPATAMAQCWGDDFESYADGPIGTQGAWEQWGGVGSPLDSVVMSDPAGEQGKILEVSGGQDAVVRFSDAEAVGIPLISGAHEFRTLHYHPAESGGSHYFIMMNGYVDGVTDNNWAVQVNQDRGAGTMTDEGLTGASIPLPVDTWFEISLLVDVDNNQQFFFVDGELFYSSIWAGHVSADPGFVQLAALDFWGNNADAAHYDEVGVDIDFGTGDCTEPAISGACCLVDGTCIPETASGDCEAMEGFYSWNLFVPCAAEPCAAYIPGEGWDLTAPVTWNGDTTFFAPECALDSNDELLKVTIPYAGPWTFSTCDTGSTFDILLLVGTTPCGTELAEVDEDGCFAAESVTLDLEPGTYYVVVSSCCLDEGPYTIDISAPCVSSIDPVGATESELCGEDLNGGCNMATPAWEPYTLGDTVNGFVWIDEAGTRDTDWYEFTNADGLLRWAFVGNNRVGDIIECGSGFDGYNVTITQAGPGSDTVMELSGESVIVAGMITDDAGVPSTDCATAAFIGNAIFTSPCNGDITVSGVIEPGTAGPTQGCCLNDGTCTEVADTIEGALDCFAAGGVPLGEFGIDIGDGSCDECEAWECTISDGDTDGDGVVDVTDLLNVLGNWPCEGVPGACLGDTNCDGHVNVTDLLDVLGNWDV